MTFDEKVALIKKTIEKVRPYIQGDGGDVEFVDYTKDRVVLVRLQGHCAGCPHAQETIKQGIEGILKEQLGDAVAYVEAVN